MTMAMFMSVYQESVSLFVQISFVDNNTVRVFIVTMRVIVKHGNVSCLLVNALRDVVMKYLETLGYQIMNGRVRKEGLGPLLPIQSVNLAILEIIFVLRSMVRVILVNFLIKWIWTAILKHSVKVQNDPTLMWDWDAFCHRSMGIRQRMYPLMETEMKLYLGLLGKHMVYRLRPVLPMASLVGMGTLV
tara:strand:+ start:77 stop:640 length:564 start_codon:yes stop_codon:yes gene_type:complete